MRRASRVFGFTGLWLVVACGGNDGPSDGGAGAGGRSTSGGAAAVGGAAQAGDGTGGAAMAGGAATAGGAAAGGAGRMNGMAGRAGSSNGGGSSASGGRMGSGGVVGVAGAGGSVAGASAGGSGSGEGAGVRIDGKRLLVDGKPFRIRGVCWNPVPKGKSHPAGLDFAGLASTDIPLMKAANINAVRTYEPLTNVQVLDQLAGAGIYVLNTVYPYGGDAASVVTGRVDAVKNHRAILMWVIGNEWNYNGLYVDLSASASQTRLNEVAALIRQADTTHPIATVYGEVPPKAVVEGMADIDVWGINAYRGISFGDLFTSYAGVSDKPMFVAEFGADAYNATKSAYDPESQAKATDALLREIAAQSTDAKSSGVAIGGTIFEWADEWWKDGSGSPNSQEPGGIAPGGGPFPDQTFNEEWWGIVDIDRKPRPAYEALKTVYGGG